MLWRGGQDRLVVQALHTWRCWWWPSPHRGCNGAGGCRWWDGRRVQGPVSGLGMEERGVIPDSLQMGGCGEGQSQFVPPALGRCGERVSHDPWQRGGCGVGQSQP